MSSGYIPKAKHNIIDLLYSLAKIKYDDRIISAVDKLLNQSSNSLKCLVARGICELNKFYSSKMWDAINILLNDSNAEVKKYAIYSLRKLLAIDNERVDEVVQRSIEFADVQTIDEFIDFVLYFYIYKGELWTKETIDKVITQPWIYRYDTSFGYLPILFDMLKKSIKDDNTDRTALIVSTIRLILDTCIKEVININKNMHADNVGVEESNLQYRVYHVIDFLLLKLYIMSGDKFSNNLKRDKQYESKYFLEIKPILGDISYYLENESFFLMPLQTMHRTIQLINFLFEHDPSSCIRYVKVLVASGEKTNYIYDSLAISEALKLMKKLFADYRIHLKNDLFLNDVITILDSFSKTGDPKIIDYLWKFEDIYR